MIGVYRVGAALAAWSGLVLLYALTAKDRQGGALVEATINFFSYFSILSNVFAALCLTTPWLAPRSVLGRFCGGPSVRTAAALYMTVTAGVNFLLLRDLWDPRGLRLVADTLLHYVTPALFVFDWLVLSPRRRLRWRSALVWLLFPLAYAAYSIVRGQLSGFYPYPFLDVGAAGLARVSLNMTILAGVFLCLGLLLIAVRGRVGGVKTNNRIVGPKRDRNKRHGGGL